MPVPNGSPKPMLDILLMLMYGALWWFTLYTLGGYILGDGDIDDH